MLYSIITLAVNKSYFFSLKSKLLRHKSRQCDITITEMTTISIINHGCKCNFTVVHRQIYLFAAR